MLDIIVFVMAVLFAILYIVISLMRCAVKCCRRPKKTVHQKKKSQ